MIKIDAIDEHILSILTRDARISNREIARLVGLSDTSVRKRIKRLTSSGAAKITTIVNPTYAGLTVASIVRLQTAPSSARQIAERAATFTSVAFVSLTTGTFNVVALVLTSSEDALADFIHANFNRWDGVQRIEAIRLIRSVKHRLDWIVINPGEKGADTASQKLSKVTEWIAE